MKGKLFTRTIALLLSAIMLIGILPMNFFFIRANAEGNIQSILDQIIKVYSIRLFA